MTRGTTPEIIATVFGVDLDNLDELYATLEQGELVIEKSLGDVIITPPHIHIYLSQEETLQFVAGQDYKMQIRGKTVEGEAFATSIAVLPVKPVLKEGVI